MEIFSGFFIFFCWNHTLLKKNGEGGTGVVVFFVFFVIGGVEGRVFCAKRRKKT